MDLFGVLQLLEDHDDDSPATARGVFARGRAPGRAPGLGRGKGKGKGKGRGRRGLGPGIKKAQSALKVRIWRRKKKREELQKLADVQVRCHNTSGRARTADHYLPEHQTNLTRERVRGKGAWKKWTPSAVLRAGFAAECSSARQTANEIDGAGQRNSSTSRFVVASSLVHKEVAATEQLAHESQDTPLEFCIRSMMFDESSFELRDLFNTSTLVGGLTTNLVTTLSRWEQAAPAAAIGP